MATLTPSGDWGRESRWFWTNTAGLMPMLINAICLTKHYYLRLPEEGGPQLSLPWGCSLSWQSAPSLLDGNLPRVSFLQLWPGGFSGLAPPTFATLHITCWHNGYATAITSVASPPGGSSEGRWRRLSLIYWKIIMNRLISDEKTIVK